MERKTFNWQQPFVPFLAAGCLTMAAQHFDLIVIGAGLAEQFVATLLAGQGFRVLSLPTAAPSDEERLACCPALDKLLTNLKGGHLSQQSIDSLQLVTDHIRLEIGGPLPLAEELRREFPDHHLSILSLLARLDEWGRKLNLLLASTAPDSSLRAIRHLTLYRRQLGHSLPARRLQQPIEGLLATLGDPQAEHALTQLLSGLCLVTPARLSIAEAALKWHITTRPQHILLPELSQFLNDRYAAAGGQSIPLDELAEIKYTGKCLDGVSLLNGRCLSARQFLVGPLPEHIELPPALTAALAKPPVKPQRWTLTGRTLRRPPMLARQVILAGEQTLRLTWKHESPTPSQALVEVSSPADKTVADMDSVRRQLASLLPFSAFALTEADRPLTEGVMHNSFWPHGGLPRPAASNVLFCHGAHLLPSIGLNADVILAQAAAGALQKRLA
jgi:hypothetical protein